jgi:branched-chain amino acid transport system substrate-binding protein
LKYLLTLFMVLYVGAAHAQTKGFGVATSAPERRVALVIGNNSYGKLPALQNAVNDARSMTKELKALGFEVLSYENANRKTMKNAVRELEDRVANGGVGFLYYSGHGVAEGGGNYLLPVDVPELIDPRELQDEAIELNGVMERLSAARAKFSLLVIDACRNNPFPRKSSRSIGTSRGLAQPTAAEGMIVVYSAGVGQEALDKLGPADRDPNGLFTREFIKEIKKPGVEVAELVRNVGKSVKDKAATIRHQQTPAIYIQSVEKFYFIQGDATSAPPQQANDAETALWQAVEKADRADEYDVYLSQYPKGKYAALAKARRAKLRGGQPAVVRIGHVAPLSGGIGHLGKDNQRGAQLAIAEANARKIQIKGVTVKFELVSEDDQADPKVGVRIAGKLVASRVAGVVGHLNSGTTIPAAAIYDKAGIPMITPSATNPALTQQGLSHVFRALAHDDLQSVALISHLVENRNIPKSAVVISDGSHYGNSLATRFRSGLEKLNRGLVASEVGGFSEPGEWKPLLEKIAKRPPDFIFFGGMDSAAAPLLIQARKMGIRARFGFGDGACTDTLSQNAGSAAEGILCVQSGIPAMAADETFIKQFRKSFREEPILYAPYAYDATHMLIEAMRQANSSEPEEYLPVLRAMTHHGATGEISFDAKGERKNAESTIFTIKNKMLTPSAIACPVPDKCLSESVAF